MKRLIQRIRIHFLKRCKSYMNEPLVSIIMGVYNEQKTIEYCIESILSQTYSNWEFIICDDCSTDETFAILKKYEEKDARFKILHNEKNLRLAASLNHCLSVAEGKYVARMDADDASLPERLTKQVEYLETHPEVDVVGCARIIFDENGERGIRSGIEVPSKEDLLKDSPFAHPTIMMKKSVYDALGGYTVSEQTMRAEDLDLWFRFFAVGYVGYNMPDVLYRYRESVADMEKRSLKAAIGIAKVFWQGYALLEYPYGRRVWALKPIVAALLPRRLMYKHHMSKLG